MNCVANLNESIANERANNQFSIKTLDVDKHKQTKERKKLKLNTNKNNRQKKKERQRYKQTNKQSSRPRNLRRQHID